MFKLKHLNSDSKISAATDLFEVNVGLVSGENDFFVMNQTTVDQFNLQDSVVPIISRSEQLKGVRLTDEDYNNLIALGKKVYFFVPGNDAFDELTDEQKIYIQWGEEKGYNKN